MSELRTVTPEELIMKTFIRSIPRHTVTARDGRKFAITTKERLVGLSAVTVTLTVALWSLPMVHYTMYALLRTSTI